MNSDNAIPIKKWLWILGFAPWTFFGVASVFDQRYFKLWFIFEGHGAYVGITVLAAVVAIQFLDLLLLRIYLHKRHDGLSRGFNLLFASIVLFSLMLMFLLIFLTPAFIVMSDPNPVSVPAK